MTKKITYRVFCFFVLLAFFKPVFSQSTNKGTEFWVPYMDNVRGVTSATPCQMSLYLTSDVSTSGTVSVADGSFSQSFSVNANQVTLVVMPQSAFLGTEGLFLKGIHIVSASPIVVYAHIYAQAVSGATLVLPVNTLAKDYYTINYTQRSNEANCYSCFAVVATEDTTTVEITPAATLNSGHVAGTPFTITLQKGQLYQGLSPTDLTGTHIRSISSGTNVCKKIAVFSGSSKIYIGSPNTSADNLFQQNYPTASWGRNFITAPLSNRDYDTYRIVVSDPSTQVTLNGSVLSSASLINNFYYEFNSTAPNVITADKPIQAVQYAVTQGNTLTGLKDNSDVGDPEMIYLNPIEQSINNVTLFSPTAYKILQSYINVIIASTSASSFTLDGAAPAGGFRTVPGNTAYSYGQFAVSSGTHNIQASTGFNAIAYGFGNAESYGYSAGTNLKNLNKFVQVKSTTGDTLTSACVGEKVKLELTLPYQTKQLIWTPQNGDPVYTDNNPVVVDTTVKENKTLYTYAYPKLVSYSKSGIYNVDVKAFNAIADACGSYEDIDISFTVYDNPVASFTTKAQNCQADSVIFTDKSSSVGGTLKSWLWSFGDGGTSVLQNPSHIYTKSGDFIATLLVTNINGCSSVLDSEKIHIYAKPVAKFSYSNPDCVAKAVIITDASTSAEGNITQWIWDFGDGSTQTLSSKTPFQHIYKAAGTYTIKLIVTTDLGCHSDTLTSAVIVHPLPVVDFVLPEICISDSYANFTDKSSIDDHTETGFTYLWDFGDPNATSANPDTSTQKNPQHKYIKADYYQVKLTVTSQNGCSADTMMKFTVNGAVPKADFTVLNANTLCSTQTVMFQNTSTLDFGNLSKVLMYYDYSNHPDQFETDENPVFNKLYTHQYPTFTVPATQNYTVLMRTYSGLTCVDEKTVVITLKANPEATFDLPTQICSGAAAFQITAKETHGYSGSGIFSGSGVNANGFFNPAVAATGVQKITYVFTADNGCADTVAKQITISPMPTVNAGKDIDLLDGGSTTLSPTVSGNNLSYQWTPATGLSNDHILNPVASPTETTTYTLTVTSADGCTNADELMVSVLKAPVIPNTFTPNNDGINDTWNIKNLDSYPNVIVHIFNRYGVELYYSVGYAIPWDGRYRGAELPVGTYYYIIIPGSGRDKIAGSITIIR